MKFRGYQIKRHSPKISLSLHSLFYSFYFPSDVTPRLTEIPPSLHWRAAFIVQVARSPDLAQVTWQCNEWRGFLLPVAERRPATSGGHSDPIYCFPLDRNEVFVMTSNFNSVISFGTL